MFNEGAQSLIELAKDVAISGITLEPETPLTAEALAVALAAGTPGATWLAELLHLDVVGLHQRYPLPAPRRRCTTSLRLSQDLRSVLGGAKKLAATVPIRTTPGLIGIAHLAAATAAVLEDGDPASPPGKLTEWV